MLLPPSGHSWSLHFDPFVSFPLRNQQPPVGPHLREAEPPGPAAQPKDAARQRQLATQLRGHRARPVGPPAQRRAPPQPCDPAARPPAADLPPREQVSRMCPRLTHCRHLFFLLSPLTSFGSFLLCLCCITSLPSDKLIHYLQKLFPCGDLLNISEKGVGGGSHSALSWFLPSLFSKPLKLSAASICQNMLFWSPRLDSLRSRPVSRPSLHPATTQRVCPGRLDARQTHLFPLMGQNATPHMETMTV